MGILDGLNLDTSDVPSWLYATPLGPALALKNMAGLGNKKQDVPAAPDAAPAIDPALFAAQAKQMADRVDEPAVPLAPPPMPRARPVEANDAGPIAVGNYQMPRIGLSELYKAQQAAKASPDQIPENATPTQGTGAPAVPETSLLGRFKQGLADNSNLLLSLGAGMAGAPSFGTGLSRGLQMAVPGSQLDLKNQNQNLTVNALIKRGLPPDLALAAATNPTILAQVLPQAFGAKQRKFTQVGEDMMGNKQFGFVDEVNGKTYDLQGNEIKGGATGATIPTGADGQPLQGPELLAHLQKTDPVTAAGVKGLIDGTENPNSRNIQKLAPLAKLVDPSFDATQYPVRLATRKSYTSGKDFQELQALNTVGGHLGKLMDSADKLGNWNSPTANKVSNWFADNFTGSPALVKFRNDLVTTANELAKAYHGGHVSDSAYAAFNKAINEAQTPAEMKAAIGELAGLLDSKIAAKESGYRTSMADAPLPSEYRALNDEARHSFAKINDWANGAPKQKGAEAAAPVRVNSLVEAKKLPSGTHFLDPNGVERVVP